MKFDQQSAIARAKKDLAERLKISESEIEEVSVEDKDFPDMAFGAPVADEMAAQMITTGWQITLAADGERYEYRADKYEMRLRGFQGTNHVIKP